MDIYIPSLNLGIEYDGVYYHEKVQRDLKKYQKCRELGISLYRIIEAENPPKEKVADRIILREKPYRYPSLDKSINELMTLLGHQIRANTFLDSVSIREQYYSTLDESSLQRLYPSIASEWLQSKNGSITQSMVSYGCNDHYWWKCSSCGNEWSAAVCERTIRGRGCPVCSRERISKKLAKTNTQFIAELEKINPNIQPLEDYKRTHTSILFRCKRCGNEWQASPANVLRGRDCPVCSRKRGIEKMKIKKKTNKI